VNDSAERRARRSRHSFSDVNSALAKFDNYRPNQTNLLSDAGNVV
jgi:hypothetical protein